MRGRLGSGVAGEGSIDGPAIVHPFAGRQELALALCRQVVYQAEQAVRDKGRFCLAISGGSLLDLLVPLQTVWRDQVDWSSWHLFWVDERWVDRQSPDSNFRAAREKLLDALAIPEGQMYPLDNSRSPVDTACQYEAELARVLLPAAGDVPRFDLLLLGVGEDGHTASLFPGHQALAEGKRWVVPVFDAPKPPPIRITLTLPVLNAAAKVFFAVSGAKRAIVNRILHPAGDQAELPAQLVRPVRGELHWFVGELSSPQD